MVPSQTGLAERLALGKCEETTTQVLTQMVQVGRNGVGTPTEVHVVGIVECPVLALFRDLEEQQKERECRVS